MKRSQGDDGNDAKRRKKDLLASVKARREQLEKRKNSALDGPLHPLLTEEPKKPNPYLSTGGGSGPARPTRQLQFNRPGKYQEKGDELRRQQAERDEAAAAKAAEEQRLVDQGVDIVANEREFVPPPPPETEWWDEQVGEITALVHHPIELKAPWLKYQPKELRLYMTKKETKRSRKLRREEEQKEQQDRIKLGLDPAPQPKLKLSNYMNVQLNEAIKDPTKLEMRVRKEMAQRQQAHEADNESRKLGKEERWGKKVDKLEADKEKGIYTAVFRIENLSDQKQRHIVRAEAESNQFTGMIVFNQSFNLLIVEGGAKPVKKYIKRLQRINWELVSEAKSEDSAKRMKDLDLNGNKCSLVWQGQLPHPKFSRWTLKDADTEQDAKTLLAKFGAESYWLQARSIN